MWIGAQAMKNTRLTIIRSKFVLLLLANFLWYVLTPPLPPLVCKPEPLLSAGGDVGVTVEEILQKICLDEMEFIQSSRKWLQIFLAVYFVHKSRKNCCIVIWFALLSLIKRNQKVIEVSDNFFTFQMFHSFNTTCIKLCLFLKCWHIHMYWSICRQAGFFNPESPQAFLVQENWKWGSETDASLTYEGHQYVLFLTYSMHRTQ